ncbi:polynucleotide 5'-hydroxyl-kinase NOL9 isoform X2 [Colius striatus]|uniref:polynucleotide 5'-hydroxyl-kinase NOL9 isoform X2 n=1 Tax=Colius striatus TaxID=57412 RepID=UPI002B1D1407|nr:polynucleotide 5'-hydroxyl-kinase NOL9 isoform X2 [Colius striatus]
MPARRGPPARRPRRAAPRAARPAAAWREFAASFARAGMVPPAEPGLAAVEAAEGAAVLLLAPGQALTFTGKCRLRCLYGAVRLLGFAVASHQPALPVFSPATHCALTLEALPAAPPPAAELRQLRAAVRAAMRAHRVRRHARARAMARFLPDGAVVLLRHLDAPVTRFLLSHPPLSRLFEPQKKEESSFTPEDAVLASVGIVKCSPDHGLLVSESMSVALEELIQACCAEDEGVPVVLVCGPKNTGKSTFNRYLINLLLNRLPAVEYMECDIGQTEFTPPGCVSLSNITEPILGPPFTHQQTPRKMVYYGQTSCEQDTERYLDVVKYVFSSYKKEVPLVINTMGWVKGEGLLLLIDIIRLLSPSHIVQMDVYDWKAMAPLTPEHVRLTPGLYTKGKQQAKCKQLGGSGAEGWRCPDGEGDASAPEYKLLYVHPEFPRAGAAGEARVHSGILRDMSILGYLGQLQSPDMGTVLPLHSLVPYQVPFSAVALRVIHTDVAPTNIMYAVNAGWVGLCRIPDQVRAQGDGPVLLTQTPLCDCLGFGIVRGVDMEKKLYHVLTPVPPESLRLVNCLLLGNIAIPNCVLVGQGIEGEIPYVTSDYNYSILGSGKLRKKKHFKRREYPFECDYT